jgi:hypothetical protein
MNATKIRQIAAQWRSDARVYEDGAHNMRHDAALKRLDGYNTSAKMQEELADASAAYGRALAECAAQIERALR